MQAIRLKKNREFRRVYSKKSVAANQLLVLYKIKNKLGVNRIGICVSKKVGKAVKRNKVRRLIKENERDIPWIKEGFDLVFLARVPAAEASYHDIRRSMHHLLQKTGMMENEKNRKKP